MIRNRIFFLMLAVLLWAACGKVEKTTYDEQIYAYTAYGRLTDPGSNEAMLRSLPDNISAMSEIANVQGVHITMMSQWKIPRSEWRLARSDHDMEAMLDTLKAKGTGALSKERKLEDRILGACTKESIFSAGMLKAKGIPARIRVGYLTNLYSGEKALEFWRNVNNYGNPKPVDSAVFDQYTLYMKEVNKAIEHWVTEYWDEEQKQWRVLDIRPEYLRSYGLDVGYHLPDQYFEFAHEAWLKIEEPDFKNDAYAEGELNGRSHIRYQMLMDFYALLNHEVPGIFDADGKDIKNAQGNKEIGFMRKKYEELSDKEIVELNALAELLRAAPDLDELIEFYRNSETLQINSMQEDPYSFVAKGLR